MKPLTDLPRSAAAAPAREQPLGLADLPLRVDAWVSALRMDAAPQDGDVLLRLLEIGFLPGERVRVVARAFPAGDPLAVRVGLSILLFVCLLVAWKLGYIQPTGLPVNG